MYRSIPSNLSLILIAICFLYTNSIAQTFVEPALEQDFKTPPASAKPHTWWHWMNGHVSKEGITADLESIQRVGIGGVQAFHISNRIPGGPVGYMTPEWRDMMKHAISEADRLKLEFCMHNAPGWSASGGVWITPELSMKKVVYLEKKLSGPTKLSVHIDQPETNKGFYRDIVILAFPTPKGEKDGKEGFRLTDWKSKAGFAPGDSIQVDIRTVNADDVIPFEKIINLTGLRSWNVPSGDWTIVRFGYTTTGVVNIQSPREVAGLECDKLDRNAAKLSWDNTVGKVISDAGNFSGKALKNVLIDSYEVKYQNWTAGFDARFEEKRGYNLIKYLPCLTGRVVNSIDVSERFLWDFRRTIADLFLTEYVGAFADLCHKNNMILSLQPYGAGNFNHLEAGVKADIPVGEFWNTGELYTWSNKLVASAAHINNSKIVGAEAFTSLPGRAWESYPGNQKQRADWAFGKGITRMIFHTYTHQPWKNVKPGMTMGPYGMFANRNVTWWEQGTEWMNYLTRCQFLLQQGTAVADLGYVLSEDAAVGNTSPHRHQLSPLPPAGYDYDFIDAGSLLKMSVKDGAVVLPSGMRYRVLIVTEKNAVRPVIAKKLNELIQLGANIVSPAFSRSPSLENYPDADAQVKSLSSVISKLSLEQALAQLNLRSDAEFEYMNLKKEGLRPIEYIHRKTNEFDIYFVANQNEQNVLVNGTFRVKGMQPELWDPESGDIASAANYRVTEDGRTTVSLNLGNMKSVFVVFRKPLSNAIPMTKTFTLNGQHAEDATLKYRNGQLVISATTPGNYSVETTQGTLSVKIDDIPEPLVINKGWTLKFPENSGVSDNINADSLKSWSEYQNPDIKYFSGTATYSVSFDIPKKLKSKINSGNYTVQLNLGDVAIIANAKLNGENLGILWRAPFETDVTNKLKRGKNKLEVNVTNDWANRLIGDEKLPPDAKYTDFAARGRGIEAIPEWVTEGSESPNQRKAFATWLHFKKDSPLKTSGLIGPVKLNFAKVEVVRVVR